MEEKIKLFEEPKFDEEGNLIKDSLSEEEKAKDRAQVIAGIKKIKSYLNGKIDIDSIIETYGIESKQKTL